MEDQACPKCKTTFFRNPNMKLLVNVCGHNLCESCVDLLFVRGSGSCPECGVTLRRTNFRHQLFEDSQIDKEVDIRKRILKDFNKKEEDFDQLSEWNDYLEMVEDIIFNLMNGIDILGTNKRIAEYKDRNKDFINKNRHRQSREALELQDILAQEAMLGTVRNRQLDAEEAAAKKLKAENKEKLIDELMFSDADAGAIVSMHEKEMEVTEQASRAPKFSTGIAAQNMASGSVRQPKESVQFVYSEPEVFTEGPDLMAGEAEMALYRSHVRHAGGQERAAGYHEDIACLRALQEGLSGLFFAR